MLLETPQIYYIYKLELIPSCCVFRKCFLLPSFPQCPHFSHSTLYGVRTNVFGFSLMLKAHTRHTTFKILQQQKTKDARLCSIPWKGKKTLSECVLLARTRTLDPQETVYTFL